MRVMVSAARVRGWESLISRVQGCLFASAADYTRIFGDSNGLLLWSRCRKHKEHEEEQRPQRGFEFLGSVHRLGTCMGMFFSSGREVGKSTTGRELRALLGWRVVDLDEEFCRRVENITVLLEKYGFAAYFAEIPR